MRRRMNRYDHYDSHEFSHRFLGHSSNYELCFGRTCRLRGPLVLEPLSARRPFADVASRGGDRPMLAWFQSKRPQPRPFPRADERLAEELRAARIGLDKRVFWGLIGQWAVVLLGTLVLSASADFESVSSLWTTLLVNGVLTGVPLWLVLRSPGERSSRMAVAVCQGLFSTLLLHATAGRMETHLHLFAWLVVMAVYRDVRVLIAAGTVAVVSQLLVGLFAASPEMAVGNLYHLGEHAAWLIGETACLAAFVRVSVQAMSDLARREAALESLNNNLERKVERRTREMSEKLDALHREYTVIRELCGKTEADETTAVRQLSQLRRDVSAYARTLMDTTWHWTEARLPEAFRPHWRTIREASQELLNLAEASTTPDDSLSDSLVGLQTFKLHEPVVAAEVKSSDEAHRQHALLLIDDPVQQALTVHSLSHEGFTVDVAHSGPRTYYSAMLQDYDLILVDVDMANEEGFDTIEALRLLPNGISDSTGVFAISSARSPEAVLRGTELGIDGFLVKPLNPESLHAALSGQTGTDFAHEGRIEREAVVAGS